MLWLRWYEHKRSGHFPDDEILDDLDHFQMQISRWRFSISRCRFSRSRCRFSKCRCRTWFSHVLQMMIFIPKHQNMFYLWFTKNVANYKTSTLSHGISSWRIGYLSQEVCFSLYIGGCSKFKLQTRITQRISITTFNTTSSLTTLKISFIFISKLL